MRLDQIGTEQLQSLGELAERVDQAATRIRISRGSRLLSERAGLLALATARALRDELLVLQSVQHWRTHGQADHASKVVRQYEQPLLPAQYLAHCAVLAHLSETDEMAAAYREQAHTMAVRNGYLAGKA